MTEKTLSMPIDSEHRAQDVCFFVCLSLLSSYPDSSALCLWSACRLGIGFGGCEKREKVEHAREAGKVKEGRTPPGCMHSKSAICHIQPSCLLSSLTSSLMLLLYASKLILVHVCKSPVYSQASFIYTSLYKRECMHHTGNFGQGFWASAAVWEHPKQVCARPLPTSSHISDSKDWFSTKPMPAKHSWPRL